MVPRNREGKAMETERLPLPHSENIQYTSTDRDPVVSLPDERLKHTAMLSTK